jgi:hypothetical protein
MERGVGEDVRCWAAGGVLTRAEPWRTRLGADFQPYRLTRGGSSPRPQTRTINTLPPRPFFSLHDQHLFCPIRVRGRVTDRPAEPRMGQNLAGICTTRPPIQRESEWVTTSVKLSR